MSPEKSIGVTTYIRDILRKKTPFRVSHRGCGRVDKGSGGLRVGRDVDHLFRRVVERKVRLDGSLGGSHLRCVQVFRVLESAGIRVVSVQDRVSSFELWTSVDGVGVDASGKRVVIELKSTGRSISEHRLLYDRVCTDLPVLANGLVNSERIGHYIQAGFGVVGFGADYGVVVVSCRDGSTVYQVPRRYEDPKLFLCKRTDEVCVEKKSKISRRRCLPVMVSKRGVCTWPSGLVGEKLSGVLSRYGKVDRAYGERLGLSCFLQSSRPGIVCLRGNPNMCKNVKRLFQRAKSLIPKLRTFMCYPKGKSFCVIEVQV